MTFADLRDKWNESYSRKENNLFEPNEELVKFLSRYIISRDPSSGAIQLKNFHHGKSIRDLTVLDIGCGIGAQSEFLTRLGFSVIGCDLSDTAIESAIVRSKSRGIDIDFRVIDSDNIPNIACDIAIACASLDSMPYSSAVAWLRMCSQQLTDNPGLLFATIIASRSDGFVGEERVSESHECGTVQYYYDHNLIKDLLGSTGFDVIRLDRIDTINLFPGVDSRSSGRFSVVAKVMN